MNSIIAVIVTFNRKIHLLKCLNALKKQSVNIDEIICIDNNSSDGTSKLLEKEGFLKNSNFQYYNTGANLGGAGGFKYAFDLISSNTKSDYYWFMDDDVIPDEECLFNLLSTASSKTIAQPTRYYLEDNSFVISESKTMNLTNPFRELKLDYLKESDLEDKDEIEISCFPFEGPLIHRDIISASKLPDDKFFIIADDTDYSIKVIDGGNNIVLNTNAKLYRQIKPASLNKNLDWKSYFYFRNLTLIDKAYAPHYVLYIRVILRYIRTLASCLVNKKGMRSIKLMTFAYLDGIRENINNDISRWK